MNDSAPPDQEGRKRWPLPLCAAVVLFTAGLVIYSQTQAFGFDEGYHLLAAQLIKGGKKPYLDFCFPQTPLAAYWNALWMLLFGESWRTVHALAALSTAGAIALGAGFVFARFPVRGWRLACAIGTVLTVGTNIMVVQFGTSGQPYGLCLLLIVAAFRCAVAAVERGRWLLPCAAGLFAGAAAGCSLLTAPVALVLLAWMLAYSRAGNRLNKLVSFIPGLLIPFLPLFWLFVQGPRQVFFNVIEYHLRYRRLEWEGATAHDLEVMTSWVDSPQVLILALLAAAGLLGNRQWRAELHLCFWLAATLIVFVSCAHPVFRPYYVLAVPFLGILASAGLYYAGSRLGSRGRPFLAVAVLAFLVCCGLAKRLYEEAGDDFFWRDMEKVARKVEEVTPPHGALLANEEHVYFLTRRPPPSGMEVEDSHKFDLPPSGAALLHVVSRGQLEKKVASGVFDTVESCEEVTIQNLELARYYARSAVIGPCAVFWQRK